MKHTHLIQATLACAMVVAMAAPAAAGRESKRAPNTWALITDGNVKINTYFFGAGFEASEGFTIGDFDGQQNWTASGMDLPFASISNANPFTGSQHLRMVYDPTMTQGTTRIVLSPEQPTPPFTVNTVYIKVNISDDGGADYDIIGQAPSQGFLTWRVKFSWSDDTNTGSGMIYVLDNVNGGLVFVNTGVQWAHGIYKELRVDFTPGEIRYYYDGALIYTGAVIAGSAVEQVGIVHDNWQLPNETADFDALSVQTLGEPPVAVKSMTWSQVKSLLR